VHPDVADYYHREIGRGEPLTALQFFEQWLGGRKAEDFVFTDAYVGPPHFTDELIAKQRAIYATIPRELRLFDDLPLPAEGRENIEPQLRVRCDVLERRPYGGCLLSLILPALNMERISREHILRLIERERALRAGGVPSYYAVIVARPKRGLAGLLARWRNP
jgi:hypothetical protein